MIFKKLAASAAAVALLAANPAVAQVASSAGSLSVAKALPQAARAGSSLRGENKQIEGTGLYVLGAVVVGLAIWGIVELVGDDNDDPDSP
jgi:hypothetical protein